MLLQPDRVLKAFRARFTGKCSPVRFCWGSNDLAVTRFSGRPAPARPGGIPHLPDRVTREAYSQEVRRAGLLAWRRDHQLRCLLLLCLPGATGFRRFPGSTRRSEYVVSNSISSRTSRIRRPCDGLSIPQRNTAQRVFAGSPIENLRRGPPGIDLLEEDGATPASSAMWRKRSLTPPLSWPNRPETFAARPSNRLRCKKATAV